MEAIVLDDRAKYRTSVSRRVSRMLAGRPATAVLAPKRAADLTRAHSTVLRARSRLIAPLVAAGLAGLVILTGGRGGGDLAAATYRVELFARSGLTLWDSQWYGGHWTFNYSVLFPPIGWLAGIPVMETVCVAVAAWAFDRLAVGRFGRAGRVGAIAFAVGTVVQVANGQEPYLLGETLGLLALVAARSGHSMFALPLAAAASLASPLAGGFLTLISIAWMIGSWPTRRWRGAALATAAAAPVLAIELLFPGLGTEPFPALNFVGILVALVPIGIVAARRDRAIAVGVAIYAVAVVFAFAVPSPIGNNITRLGVSFGVALGVILAVERRRGRALLIAAAIPLALAQWIPARQALLGEGNSSLAAAYFQPLLRYLGRADRPLGRVEVVPTVTHWEAVYVAPFFPIARGWERQLDTGDDAIFYQPGRLTGASYRAWLFANGVRFVALPDVALDYAAHAEGQLVRSGGVPGVDLVWHDEHWRVYRVIGAPGIVSGPAKLLSATGAKIRLNITRTGVVLVREHYVAAWHVTRGQAVLTPARGGWLNVHAAGPGPVTLQISL